MFTCLQDSQLKGEEIYWPHLSPFLRVLQPDENKQLIKKQELKKAHMMKWLKTTFINFLPLFTNFQNSNWYKKI